MTAVLTVNQPDATKCRVRFPPDADVPVFSSCFENMVFVTAHMIA